MYARDFLIITMLSGLDLAVLCHILQVYFVHRVLFTYKKDQFDNMVIPQKLIVCKYFVDF